MSKQSICERERSQLEKMNKFQLGNQFKKIGFIIAIGTFMLMIGRKYIDNSEWVKPILHGILLIGLLIMVLVHVLHKLYLMVQVWKIGYPSQMVEGLELWALFLLMIMMPLAAIVLKKVIITSLGHNSNSTVPN